MTAEPHPQRCETCTKQSCHYHANNNYWKGPLPQLSFFYDVIDIVGCASHTLAAENQIDEMLSDLKEFDRCIDE